MNRAEAGRPGERIHFIDELRGFCIVVMIVHHSFYDLTYLFGMQWSVGIMSFLERIAPCFAFAFVLISGFSCCLSRDNCKRGAQLFLIAAMINIFTLVAMPENAIRFGVLNMLSVSMLICGAFQKLFLKLNRYICIAVLVLLFIITFNISRDYIGIRGLFTVDIPPRIAGAYDLYPFGIVTPGFESSDYYPLIPWTFLFFVGFNLGRFALEGRLPRWMYVLRAKPLSFIGRHSLLIYVVHQPVIYGALYLLFAVLR
ncbi:MAG: DUF1624 domain-containing protein [Clostridia bacterium]|nr:DUF1624 domain-containing protein [Clostridia bacterium]